MKKYMIGDKFIILKTIGKGAFSVVYKVKRVEDSKQYALKKVPLKTLKEKEIQNALNEVRILASIKHPNIIAFKEAFYLNESHELCIVMEYAQGGDLSSKIKECRKNKIMFPENVVIKYFYQLTSALRELHEKKIIHRDLKTANIFMSSDLQALKVGDMNVSKIIKNHFAYTQTGTPYYASPEVWRDNPYNTKTDIWSLGCVMFEICNLSPPFNGVDMDELYQKIQDCKHLPFNSQYSQKLQQAILKLLNPNPHTRPSCEKILNFDIFNDIKILFK